MSVYAKAANLGRDMQNDAAEIKLEAEVRAGELLKAMEKRHGARDRAASHDTIPLLPDLGIKPDQSSRWQRIASVPAKERAAYVAEARETVGAALGMSGKTYERAKAVVEAAKADPEKYKKYAEAMDKS